MSETTTLLKVGATDLVLRMIEAGTIIPDLTLDNPIRAIREVSHDMTGRSRVELASGRQMSALQIQYEYLTTATDFTDTNGRDPVTERVLEMWQRVLGAIETGNLDTIAREIDWVTKYQLIERYRARHDLPLSAPRIAQLDLAYHDLRRDRGLYYQLQRNGAVHRVTRDLDIFEAKSIPPQTTRAKLRGEFIRRAQDRRRAFAVDWVHLKLHDQAQRTVHRADARVWYKADGCEDFVGVVLGNALSQRPIEFLNSGCVPVRAQLSGGLRRSGKEDDAGSAPAQPVDRICVRGLLLHQPQEGVFHEAAAREGWQSARFVDGQQMRVIKQYFEVLRSVRFDPGWTVPDKGLA